MSEKFVSYEEFAEVYDELMDDVPYESWSKRVISTIEKYGISKPERDAKDALASERNLVLDLGCGTGNLTELLYDAGYDMIGVDNSESMLRIAMNKKAENGKEILYLCQDMRELSLYSTVGTIVSVCDSINYITEPSELLKVFQLVNNYLYPEGLFIFDFNTTFKYSEVMGETTIAENREDVSFIWENYYDPATCINEYDLTLFVKDEDGRYSRFFETHTQRGYNPWEIKKLLEEAGLTFVDWMDAETEGTVTGISERVYVIARENGKRKNNMPDYLVRATAAGAQIRAFACDTKDLVEKARGIHNTSPVMTAALGRLMSGALMMGSMLKGDDELLTLQIKGDGPAQGLTVTADGNGHVKGYAIVPDVILPANKLGKLDVAGAIGKGYLSVVKDLGLKEPYVGQVELQTGEIAEDLTYYFAASEQTPSVVGLGVLMNKDNTVRQAGGFILQLMPFCEDATIDKLEAALQTLPSVTTMLDQGMTPEDILKRVLDGFDIEFTDHLPVSYTCNCSRERVSKALMSIGKKDLQEMIDEGKDIETNCHFCNTNYIFTVEELKELAR